MPDTPASAALPLARDAMDRPPGAPLDLARERGATDAEVEVSAAVGQSVTVRRGEVETVEYNRDKGWASPSISASAAATRAPPTSRRMRSAHASRPPARSRATRRRTMPPACPSRSALAATRPTSGSSTPGDSRSRRRSSSRARPKRRRSPWTSASPIPKARRSRRTTPTSSSPTRAASAAATRPRGRASACGVVAEDAGGMQRDYWYTSHRDPTRLEDPRGRRAHARASARCAASGRAASPPWRCRCCSTPTSPAASIGHFVSAASGSSLYRRSSFLLDRLGTRVFAPASRSSTRSRTCPARWPAPRSTPRASPPAQRRSSTTACSRAGSCRATRRASSGLETTGNAGGNHNLVLQPGAHDLAGLLRAMGRGLLVTELMGQGVNPVTGDYSRGAAGFWVEGGEIRYPGRGSHHRRQPARHVPRHRGRRQRRARPRLPAVRLDPRRSHDHRRRS